MDVFTHGLWGMTLIRKRKLLILAFFFAILPDILGASVAFTMNNILSIPLAEIPSFFYHLYYFTHSLSAFLIILLILYLFLRKYLILALPYLSHLILDLPSHEGIFANRPFYPFSNYAVQGFFWEKHWWVTAVSALALLLVSMIILLKNKWRNTLKASKT